MDRRKLRRLHEKSPFIFRADPQRDDAKGEKHQSRQGPLGRAVSNPLGRPDSLVYRERLRRRTQRSSVSACCPASLQCPFRTTASVVESEAEVRGPVWQKRKRDAPAVPGGGGDTTTFLSIRGAGARIPSAIRRP